MKKRVVSIIIVALIMTGIPLFTVKNNVFNDISKHFNSNTENYGEQLKAVIAEQFKEEYCAEALAAIGIILNTNIKAGVKYNGLSKSDFVKKYKSGDTYYSKIEKTVEEIKDNYITYKGKAVIIPCSYITNGKCENSEDYPYLRNTATPYDLIKKGMNGKNNSAVSFNGINRLCNIGLDRYESLNRYLQNIEITAA